MKERHRFFTCLLLLPALFIGLTACAGANEPAAAGTSGTGVPEGSAPGAAPGIANPEPVNAAVLLFSAITHWNAFIDTQLYNYANPELYTMQYVLFNTLGSKIVQSLERAKQAGMVQQRINAQSMKMAISVITIVPVMFVYPFLQRFFVSGIMVGSIKA